MSFVDLRSDTVTQPSEAMRAAMAAAEVGDDWYGDDPTVNRLTERAAEILGKEAATYLPTGTMANQIALHLQVRSGHTAICGDLAHVGSEELAGSAVLSGISYARLRPADHRITADVVREAIEPDWYGFERVDLLCIENTLQAGGGLVMPLAEARAIRRVATEAELPIHLDGARLFNAAAAAGCEASDFAAEADTVMFCLSKGLGAPIGSMLAGPADLIEEAWRVKVLFGGAWRQAGILAAAGLIALEEGPKRLHEDHERATRLAAGVADALPNPESVRTPESNMVFVDPGGVGQELGALIARLKDEGILTVPVSGNVRMVAHVDIDDEGVDRAIDAWRTLAKEA